MKAIEVKEMRKTMSMFVFEFKLFFRNVINLIFVMFFPSSMILLFGSIFGNEPSELFGGYGTVDVSVPAYICMIAAVTGLMSLPITLCTYRQNKVLKRLRATTLSPANIIGTQFAVNFLMTIIGIGLLVVVALAVFCVRLRGSIVTVALLSLLVICCIVSIGLLIASVFKSAKTATAVANIVYFPMIFLSGATIPFEIMPDAVQKGASILPLTHAVIVLKSAWLNMPFEEYYVSFIILLAILVVCSVLSVICFKWE